jgi:hypothetical protein
MLILILAKFQSFGYLEKRKEEIELEREVWANELTLIIYSFTS